MIFEAISLEMSLMWLHKNNKLMGFLNQEAPEVNIFDQFLFEDRDKKMLKEDDEFCDPPAQTFNEPAPSTSKITDVDIEFYNSMAEEFDSPMDEEEETKPREASLDQTAPKKSKKEELLVKNNNFSTNNVKKLHFKKSVRLRSKRRS